MNKLHKFLDQASQAYYTGIPIISDIVFDKLAESCNYLKVGATTHGKKSKHLYQMFSLQKWYENEGKPNPLANEHTTSSIKLDGAAISLLYIDGYLVQALTRGDGVEGQVITDKIFEYGNLVPIKIPISAPTQITGEIVAPKYIENARNYAAGSLNLKDLAEFRTRALQFFAYQMIPNISSNWLDELDWLKSCGFNTVIEPDLDSIYPSDGVVVRVVDNNRFQELGFTSKHPRGALAVKERAKHVETKLLGVEWNVGKTGKVTPTAILEPVFIGDALVSRATLNNPGFIEALDLQIGDIVAVARSGEIIPCILHKVNV
ncbi:DNA ligase [bacterium]|nr:DNA ligase [bacterium]